MAAEKETVELNPHGLAPRWITERGILHRLGKAPA